jgi:hypothetical protein
MVKPYGNQLIINNKKKMKKLNLKTCPGLKGRLYMPIIKVSKSSIIFNDSAARLLALDPKNETSRIGFELDGTALYMYWDNADGFPLAYGKKTKKFGIHNTYLSTELMKHVGQKNPRLLIGAFNEGKYRICPLLI